MRDNVLMSVLGLIILWVVAISINKYLEAHADRNLVDEVSHDMSEVMKRFHKGME